MPLRKNGFTLIELLVVISIIAILSVVGLVVFQNAQKSAKDAKIKADLNAIKKAYETNYDPTANGGQGGYKKLDPAKDFAGGQPPKKPDGTDYTYAYGPDHSATEVDGYQVSATTSDGKPIYASSTQGTFTSQGTLGTCDPGGALRIGLQGYWKMDEPPGSTTAADYTGNNPGTYRNGATTTAGQSGFGNAGSFDGADDYVVLASQPSLADGFTFSAWAKRVADVASREIFNNNQFFLRVQPETENSANPFEAFVKLSDGSLESRANSGVASTVGTWFHVVVTWDKTTLKIYVDGVFKGSSTRTGTLTSTTAEVDIGRGEQGTPNVNYWNGNIDDVRFYNRVLPQDEISLLAGGCVVP